MTLKRALLAWLLLSVVAFANGTARALLLAPYLPELRAHQLSTVLGIVLLGAAIWFLTGRWRFTSSAHAWGIGLLWCLLTVAFEFSFGRAMGYRWERLLADYALWEGRLWSLVPLWVLVAPPLFYRYRAKTPR